MQLVHQGSTTLPCKKPLVLAIMTPWHLWFAVYIWTYLTPGRHTLGNKISYYTIAFDIRIEFIAGNS